MERPFHDAAMLHFIRDSLFRSDSPLHHWRIRGAEALDGNVGGRGCERKRARRRQETARRTRKRAHREDGKKKSREEEGEGDAGVTSKRMKPGLEHPGKMGARTRTTEWWRPWTGTSGVGAALDWSVWGCIRRKKQRRRGARAHEQGTVERDQGEQESGSGRRRRGWRRG